MKYVIGFANKFYTLWSCDTEEYYYTDVCGNHHVSGSKTKYYYHKNISFDLDKVKSLYPNVSIDEELRGKTRSFVVDKKEEPIGYFWFGKYYGHKIDSILETDFNYCMWALSNCYSTSVVDYISNHNIYQKHLQDLINVEQNIINNSITIKVGDVILIDFESNGVNHNSGEKSVCEVYGTYKNVKIVVTCGYKMVYGKYPYAMPILNGIAKKTKNKQFTVEVNNVLDTYVNNDQVVYKITVL